tara:strand:- start:50 stop:268 length:219 start_codon:yes stop_codon:yes gene_type:complete
MEYNKQYIMINKEPKIYDLKEFIIHLVKQDINYKTINTMFALDKDCNTYVTIKCGVDDSIYPQNITQIKRVL